MRKRVLPQTNRTPQSLSTVNAGFFSLGRKNREREEVEALEEEDMFKRIEFKESKLTQSYLVNSRGGKNASEKQGVKRLFLS